MLPSLTRGVRSRPVRGRCGRRWRSTGLLLTAAAVGVYLRRGTRRATLDWTPGGGTQHLGPPLAHRSLGAGPPRVLLLHGLAGSGRYWGGAYDALAADGALIVPDLAGFGRSVGAPGPYDLPGHADAVADLLRSHDVAAPVVVGAHSLGTNVAVALAARHPELVGAIVAFGPPWYPDPEVARGRLDRMGPMARIFALDARWSHRVCEWVCDHRELAARIAVVARQDLPAPVAADGVRHTWASYEQALRSILSAAVAEYLHSASVPITVVAGDSDGLVDRQCLQTLAAAGTIGLDTWRGNHDLPLALGQECAAVLATVAGSFGPLGAPSAMRGAAAG